MISAIRIASTHAARVNAPKAIGATRSLAIGDAFGKKEKVEEDRYIRAREKQIAESRHRAAEAEAHAAELAAADKAKIAAKNAAMHEIADLLAKTGDVVSEGDLPFFTCDQSY
ncbi:hypothetical protein HJC23_006370 [Cyclotella cryptica]|uniref:Uncharacterized protein n=1 Tax=Cyclotella cryptica TaxID=29204 RepID=A0ABD3Q4Z5_9STRA